MLKKVAGKTSHFFNMIMFPIGYCHFYIVYPMQIKVSPLLTGGVPTL